MITNIVKIMYTSISVKTANVVLYR